MGETLRGRIKGLLNDKRNRASYLRVLAIAGLVVGAFVAVILMQRGVAMVHTEQVLDCHAAQPVAHTHNADCYDEWGNLVCPLPERDIHVHDDSCYTETRTLVCGLEEEPAHQHMPSCYDEEGNLICGMEETEGHTHTDACYEVTRELTCGMEEITEEHVHGPGCFKTITVDDGEDVSSDNDGNNTFSSDTDPDSNNSYSYSNPNADDIYSTSSSSTSEGSDAEMPAQSFSHAFKTKDANGNEYVVLRIDVEAPVGALPVGSSMKAEWVDTSTMTDKQQKAVEDAIAVKADGKITQQQAVDITFFDAQGNEVEPAEKVTVTFTSELANTKDNPVVVHIDDLTESQIESQQKAIEKGKTAEEAEPSRTAKVVDKLEDNQLANRDISLSDNQLAFDAKDFSTYVLAVTTLQHTMRASGETVTITVEAPASAGIPADAVLQVTEVGQATNEYEGYLDQVTETLPSDESVELARFFDIKILDGNGNEIQPAEAVSVQIQLADAPTDQDATATIVHFADEGGMEQVDATEIAGTSSFDASSFSVYGVVYTVDFSYEVNGQIFEFSIPGSGYLSLHELVETLQLAEASGRDASEFVADVESVSFSTPTLVWVGKVDADTTVAGLKAQNRLDCVPSAGLSKEQLDAIDATEVRAGDWAILSMAPFSSEESLTITMRTGEAFTVQVTDAQLSANVLTASGEKFVVTVTYGENAGIPDGARLVAEEVDSAPYMGRIEGELGSEWVTPDITAVRTFDISILSAEGEVVEPQAPVEVDIRLEDGIAIEQGDTTALVHFVGEDECELIEPETTLGSTTEEIGELTFVTESFSKYSITTYSGNLSGLANKTFILVDARNHALQSIPSTSHTDRLMAESATLSDNNTVLTTSGDGEPVSCKWTFVQVENQSNQFYLRAADGENVGKYLNISTATNNVSGRGLSLSNEPQALTVYANNNTFRIYLDTGDGYYNAVNDYGSGADGDFAVYRSNITDNTDERFTLVETLAPYRETLPATLFFVDRSGNTLQGTVTYADGTPVTPVDSNDLSQGYVIYPDKLDKGSDGTIDLSQFKIDGYTLSNTHRVRWEDLTSYSNDSHTIIGNSFRLNNGSYQYEAFYRSDDTSGSGWYNLGMRPTNFIRENGQGANHTPISDENSNYYLVYSPNVTGAGGSGSGSGSGTDPTPDALATKKEFENNGDGTYDITLSVTGSAKQVQDSKNVNVVVVFDTSSSMVSHPESTTSTRTRLQASKIAINNFADKLLQNNTDSEPNRVQMALIDFNRDGYTNKFNNGRDTWTNNYTVFSNAVGEYTHAYVNNGINNDGSIRYSNDNTGLNTLRGTNWAQALDEVIALEKPDNDPTYVLFFTDGAPSQYWEMNANYEPSEYIDGMGNYLGARDEAREVMKDGKVELYGVFAYGSDDDETRDYLGKMVAYAYQNDSTTFVDDHRVYAQNTDQLEQKLEEILKKITKDFGYEDVQVKDGITNLSHTSMVSGTPENFTYTVTDKLKNRVIIKTGAVNATTGEPEITGLAVGNEDNLTVTGIATINAGSIIYRSNPNDSTTEETIAAEAATISYTCDVAKGTDDNVLTDGNGKPIYVITVTATYDNRVVGEWSVGTASYVSDSTASTEIGPKSVTWKPVPPIPGKEMLNDQWTYDLSFTVWPSQDAYDLIANLSNGTVKLTNLADDVLIQLIVAVNGDSYNYDVNSGKWVTSDSDEGITTDALQTLVDSVLKTNPATFYLKTNTKATVDYTPVTEIDGHATPGTPVNNVKIDDPKGGMVLNTNTMTVRKDFAHAINSANPYTKLCFYLMKDGKYYLANGETTDVKPTAEDAASPTSTYYRIDLPKKSMSELNGDTSAYWAGSNWSDEVYIAPGLMRDNEVLETGHDYSLYEIVTSDEAYEYEFTPQTVRPMNEDSSSALTYLVKMDDYNKPSQGDFAYTFAQATTGQQYDTYTRTKVTADTTGSFDYYSAAGNNGKLTGTNRKTAELDITKIIDDQVGKMSDAQLDKETFTYRVTLTAPIDADVTGVTAYEYVPRWTDTPSSTRYTIFGYQTSDEANKQGFNSADAQANEIYDDVDRFRDKIYGGYRVRTAEGASDYTMKHMFKPDAVEGDGSPTTKTAVIEVTLKRWEIIRFTNLPSGTEYTIEEVYANLRPSDPSLDDFAGESSETSNIAEQGYTEVDINTKSYSLSAGTAVVGRVDNNTRVTGTIDTLDARYYNQFVNRIKEEYAVLNLVAVKQLLGYNWSGERYFYSVEGQDGLFLPVTVSQAFYISNSSGSDPHSYQYGTMRFTEPGEYKIKITEAPTTDDRYRVVNSSTGAVTYYAIDGVEGYGEEKVITVTVEEQADGTLVVTSAVDDKGDTVLSTNPTTNQATVTTTFTNSVTSEVALLKIGDNDEEIKLSEVQFELYSDSACRNKITTDSMGNTLGTDGVVTTDPDGVASLGQLAAGTYYIKEIVTKDGYNLLNAPVELKLELQTEQSEGYKFKYVISGKIAQSDYKGGAPTDPNADGYFVINNTSGVELPMTGGMGTLPFTLVGVSTIALAAAWLVFNSKNRRNEI